LKPREHINPKTEEDPMAAPAVAWFEVTGKDGPAMQRFYGDLFDWPVQDAGDGSGYGLVQAGERGIGGGIGAESLGGQTIVPPTTLEQFRLTFAFFADPEGHVVGLSKGAVQ
jgi:predicted enzyme related to lactoylglutathione lyase